MPRLIDDLRASGRVMMPYFVLPRQRAKWTEYAQHLANMGGDPDMPVLLLDNVAQYFYNGTDQEYWDVAKDFPNIAPPFPRFWCEWKMVTHIRSKAAGDTDLSWILPQGGRVGQLFTVIDPKDAVGHDIPENARWLYWMDMWIDYSRPDAVADGPHGATWVAVDAEGRVIGNPWIQAWGDEASHEVMKNIMSWYNPAFLAISFMHCKNVAIIDHAVDKPLAKKWASKHGGLQPTKYKTLVIEPLKQVLRSEGRAEQHGLQKALHICRGHFADYTEGRGLFGKIHGKFWMPSTVRGTKGKSAPPREIVVKV